ncbi:type III secretion system translocon subunit SctE [Yersinia enterocolitica]|uniref:type III secretion system translocon subunit SctE n=1 Tax=Yersinia enterocolitica TaxID=630 RepID=UPI0009F3B04A|nr:type III secretion system translocon subunit SctE [Yersinia enterocolitica]PNM19880.1 type III secretion protein [Yersinia enterocolitica]HDL8505135.1 type III secretion system translocon subunit SctE [Yersinia enterocolitica]
MVDIKAGSDRINNILTFTQGANFNQIRDDSTKNLFDVSLGDAVQELASMEQEKHHRVKGAPRLVMPKMTLAQAKSEAAANQSSAEEAAGASISARHGANSEATSQTSGFNAAASLMGSLATVRQIVSDSSLSSLRGRLQMINIESSVQRERAENLLSAFENSTNELQQSSNEVTKCQLAWRQSVTTVKGLTGQQLELQSSLNTNQQKLTTTQQQLAKTTAELKVISPPQDLAQLKQHELLTDKVSGLSIRLSALQVEQQQLSTNLTKLKGTLSKAQLNSTQLENAYKQVLNQATEIAKLADQDRIAINEFIESSVTTPKIDGERWDNYIAILALLTAELKMAMGEDAIKDMEKKQEVLETISAASRRDSEKKAKEAEAAQRKADEASKTASCTSKIFSYIMLAVSVVATIATLGTAAPLTLAIAAVGIALTVTDIVLEETGQGSLMQMLAAEISTGISNMLMTFGMSAEKAKEIGNIVGMVLAAVAFLAISLFSMSSFFKNAGQMISNLAKNGSKLVGNLMKSAVKALPTDLLNSMGKVGTKATNLSKSLAQIADKTDDVAHVADKAASVGKTASVTARKIEMGMNGTNMVLGVTNAAVSGGLNLQVGANTRITKEMMAGLMLNIAMMQFIEDLLKSLIASVAKNYDQLNEMFNSMLTALDQSGTAKANIIKSSFA